MADGGEVLAPEEPAVAVTQVVAATDMADWIVASAAAGRTGTYNAVAPAVPLAQVLDAARRASADEAAGDIDLLTRRPPAELVWVPWEFLEAEGVQPWTDLPAWLPAPMARLLAADGSRAAAAGLVSRPIEAVVADIAAWDGARPQGPLRAGLTREREAELLSRFRSGRSAGPPTGP
jgi:2'-hydroxyisoflavone reductase